MRTCFLVLTVGLLARPLQAQGEVFDVHLMGGLTKLVSWIDSLDTQFDALIGHQKAKQAARRMDRLASSLYRLCRSKDDLVMSLSSPIATDQEISEDGYRIQGELEEVHEQFDKVGEMMIRRGSSPSEEAIRGSLNGKAIEVERLTQEFRRPGFDRSRAIAQAKQAATLCRKAQTEASSAAAHLESK